MNIIDSKETRGVLKFTVNHINVSVINALRRCILSDIPTVVFKTSPYEEKDVNILTNTSRFNNEILSNRLSCIPIHITDLNTPIDDYLLEVNVQNNTDAIVNVTTKDFCIINTKTNTKLSVEEVKKIFPPNPITDDYIIFTRLRSKISDTLKGEHIHLTCKFSINTAATNEMFNVVSTCSYGNTVDNETAKKVLQDKIEQWNNENKTQDELDVLKNNWELLDKFRITIPDSFDFIIESVGVFTNKYLIKTACKTLISQLKNIYNLTINNKLEIIPTDTTIKNSYDIILQNEDYTIGKIIEYMLYETYYDKTVTFVGFKKEHPHDNYSVIRIAYKNESSIEDVSKNIIESIDNLINMYTTLSNKF